MVYFFCVEHCFECLYCGEEISMVLDTSVARQTYIEDCEVLGKKSGEELVVS